ncbi:alpha-rhamnosidase [Dyadobacter sp. CY312]|uniref:alpha-L-rhamnosidase-related protein n=1 Tax=Dyadobacter sp. CY312 TaxID=2907303 RepID=UPI001F285BDA|nr:alpha-rhamnosidase [Dyadobacter sp. CY312]MCE7041357.1 alpha-rhamnosidase [Dyadobacter sp. CY312]
MQRNKFIFSLILLTGLLASDMLFAQGKATWIWYPGDYEIWLGNNMQNRRTERGSFLPPFWKYDSHFIMVDYSKEFDLKEPEEIEIYTEGDYNVKINSNLIHGTPKKLLIPAGKQKLNFKVYAQDRVPALFVKGKTIVSDASWKVTNEDKEWIDESGKVSDVSGTKYLLAGSWNFENPLSPPSKFKLPTEPQAAVSVIKTENSWLVDFGKETFGFVKLHGLKGKGKATLYYGESKEEALGIKTCETLDDLEINNATAKDTTLTGSRAFRFVNIHFDAGINFESVSMLYEFLPVADRGAFKSSDEQLNKIWEVSKYTLHLNTREFFIDGIKRDRWIWSGDAYQSYLMNYYLLFDSPSVTRTLLANRGKDPVTSHVNTIMDYTFYWFMGIYDYYLYSGDKLFIQQFYPRMQSLMDFCLSRRNKDGLLEGQTGDWVFIDWADGLSKKGEVSFEQLLFCRSLEAMALCANIAGDKESAVKYTDLAKDLKAKLFSIYWNEDKSALVHSRVDGVQTENVTRYANMFGIFFDYFNEAQKQAVKKNVLLNDKVQKITTPYMRFYELEALCAMGEQALVLKEMKEYWGGMLNLGATSFWEKYDPNESGAQHYAMYGREFGKSLCHAWGASPIYLLGKYYLGVKPTSAAYAAYSIEPVLGGLQWMEGKVPTGDGDISVYCSTKEIRVKGDTGTGTLRFKSKTKPVSKGNMVRDLGNDMFEMTVEKGKEYVVKYSAK